MATVTGDISTIVLDEDYPSAQVSLELCGYGSQIPRVNGIALIGQLKQMNIELDANGNFTIQVQGNDLISPAGTYYVLTVANSNGDVVQVNAYRFLSDGTSYDLNLLEPYDPNQPPPPLPPLITNLLLVVPWNSEMEFPGDVYTSFRTTLTGDVTSITTPDTVQGNLYTFIIQQDATGGHAFPWSADFLNPSPINPNPNGLTVQTFVMGTANLIAISAATWLN
jgi:hypothetical protein